MKNRFWYHFICYKQLQTLQKSIFFVIFCPIFCNLVFILYLPRRLGRFWFFLFKSLYFSIKFMILSLVYLGEFFLKFSWAIFCYRELCERLSNYSTLKFSARLISKCSKECADNTFNFMVMHYSSPIAIFEFLKIFKKLSEKNIWYDFLEL